jgi:hypothetical protein
MHKEELRAFLILTECYSGDQFEDDEMGWECGTCGGEKIAYGAFMEYP